MAEEYKPLKTVARSQKEAEQKDIDTLMSEILTSSIAPQILEQLDTKPTFLSYIGAKGKKT